MVRSWMSLQIKLNFREMDNIFFDLNELKSCGKNVIIGKTVRIRYPELVEIGDDVVIDDFTYISTPLKIHSNVHIGAGCKIIGGKSAYVEMKDFSGLAQGVVLVAGTDDYIGGIGTPTLPVQFKGDVTVGKIILNKHCIIACNAVVLPNVILAEGACVGALSLVNKSLEEYGLYGGVPAKLLRQRNKTQILELEQAYKKFKEEQ